MFYPGLDLGQKRDHSAICVVERVEAGQAFPAAGVSGGGGAASGAGGRRIRRW
jgi:hypothetical protein